MISIWFFVALIVAFVAVQLLRRRYVGQATHANDGEHMIDHRDVKADGNKRSGGCCH